MSIGDDFYEEKTTSQYSTGTCVIYRGPKKPKPREPVYGFKFVSTESKKVIRKNAKKYATLLKRLANR